MKLTILGSGTSVPHPQRTSPANWLETSKGTVLLDCGGDAPHRMAEEQLDWPNLDAIWISHFHLDHIGGLTPFLWGTKWAPQTQNRTKPLRIYGPAGLRHLIDAVNESNNFDCLNRRSGSRSSTLGRVRISSSCQASARPRSLRRIRKKVWPCV